MDIRDVNSLADCAGAVEATNYERLSLWREYTQRGISWEASGQGFMVQIGSVEVNGYDMPVWVCWGPVRIDGRIIALFEPKSQVVDHRMVKNWLQAGLPQGAPICDAMNAANAVWPEGSEVWKRA